jgi:hypothetical protein
MKKTCVESFVVSQRLKRSHSIAKHGSPDAGIFATQPALPPLKICIVFDDDASALSAEVLIRHTAPDLPCEVRLFAFDELDPPGPGVTAARTASNSDVLVVAVRDDHALPVHMQLWLGLCLGLRDQDLGGILVSLVRRAEEVADPESSLLDYLETVAAIGGLSFCPG